MSITSSLKQPVASSNPVILPEVSSTRMTTATELAEDLKSIWTGHNTPTDIWLRPMPAEHFVLLAERLLNKFIMINKDDVKKESMVMWMNSVEGQLGDVFRALDTITDHITSEPEPAPDPKVVWATAVDEQLESIVDTLEKITSKLAEEPTSTRTEDIEWAKSVNSQLSSITATLGEVTDKLSGTPSASPESIEWAGTVNTQLSDINLAIQILTEKIEAM